MEMFATLEAKAKYNQDIVGDIFGRCRLAMEPTLGGGVSEKEDQLIKELVERRLVPVGVDESKEIHHVVQSRDDIVNGLLFSHHK
jgi:hypothetical protein